MPGANRHPRGRTSAGRSGGASRSVPTPFVLGDLALGLGLLLLGPAHLDHYADDRVTQHVEPITYHHNQHAGIAHIERAVDLTRRLWLDRTLDLALQRKLTCAPHMLNPRLAQ